MNMRADHITYEGWIPHKCSEGEELLKVRDYAELARLGQVSRARISQIMNLLNLAPQIQEAILFLPRVTKGRDPVREHHLRSIGAVLDWSEQRRLWDQVQLTSCSRLPRSRTMGPHWMAPRMAAESGVLNSVDQYTCAGSAAATA